jgi:hypothetical protein
MASRPPDLSHFEAKEAHSDAPLFLPDKTRNALRRVNPNERGQVTIKRLSIS